MSKNKHRYEHGYVTFLDILGFGEWVASGVSAKAVKDKIDGLDKAFGMPADVDELFGERQIAMSDSVVRVAKLRGGKGGGSADLREVLLSLIHGQIEAIFDLKLLLRGAVTIGPVFIDKSNVFGPAFQMAVALEKRVKGPFIAVDTELMDGVEMGLVTNPDESPDRFRKDVRNLVTQIDGGVWVLDYLRNAATEMDNPERYPDLLMMHRDVCAKGILAHHGVPKVYEKYVMLARYHNSVIDQLNADSSVPVSVLTINIPERADGVETNNAAVAAGASHG